MDKDYICCAGCGNRLGERVPGGLVAQRHKGRRCLAFVVLIQCEGCGTPWTPGEEFLNTLRTALGLRDDQLAEAA